MPKVEPARDVETDVSKSVVSTPLDEEDQLEMLVGVTTES